MDEFQLLEEQAEQLGWPPDVSAGLAGQVVMSAAALMAQWTPWHEAEPAAFKLGMVLLPIFAGTALLVLPC